MSINQKSFLQQIFQIDKTQFCQQQRIILPKYSKKQTLIIAFGILKSSNKFKSLNQKEKNQVSPHNVPKDDKYIPEPKAPMIFYFNFVVYDQNKCLSIYYLIPYNLQQQTRQLLIHIIMKGFTNRIFKIYNKNNKYGSFCKSKDYFENKKMRQADKARTIFRHDDSKLKNVQINLKTLSPNFFTKTLPIKESQKVIMNSKQQNCIQNSYISMMIPVSSDQDIKNTLVRLKSNQVRIGRILQCMDSIAGIVGYRHCFGSLTTQNPFVLVTGCVDSINLFEPITVDEDIKMQGYVNYVGKTSMEIQINLFQSNILKSNALFTMISRNSSDHTKGYPCPKISISHLTNQQLQKAKRRLIQGQANAQRNRKQLSSSYKTVTPSQEDIKIIHDIFLNSAQRSKQGKDSDSTIITNTRLMHVQERNIHNKIFGGFLMRQMIQTGWITASRFSETQDLHIQDITDVYFKRPVEIGCHLKVIGRVSYTHGNILVVTMEAWTYNFNTDPVQKLCCELQIFFRCKQNQKKVFPRSYQSGIYYLTSRNIFHHAFPAIKQQNM